ncbi:MAG: tRNA (adenosine(37)-N6)-dimethylallyltransferase MiaA [Prevotella sp.]|nr:tRNA (adenosine(37)-N6)-dimethylallyltransferase MiaA [Prevotella sp.]
MTLFVVLGPTGVGKTETTLVLAERLGIPIINADSRQLFAEIPIGTAAPTYEQQQRVKHFFVGTLHLSDYYSASMYENDVLRLLSEDSHFTHSPYALLSGGSMMYIDAVCEGIDDIPTVDSDTRSLMKERLSSEGLERLCEELRVLDPDYYSIVDQKNPRRVVHALEICYMTGKPYSHFRRKERKERPFKVVKIGLTRPREELYARINRRVEMMMESGLLDEVRCVLPYRNENALNTVGYKELFDYFDGLCTLENAVERIQNNTRKYCRKQLTWFKKDPSTKWFHPDDIEGILDYIGEKPK